MSKVPSAGTMLAVLLATGVTVHAALLSVTNVNSLDPNDVYALSLGDLTDGKPVHIDRAHTVTNLPAELDGADYVLTANDDKTVTNLHMTVSFDLPTTLYLSIDNRAGDNRTTDPPALGPATMGWVPDQGWEETDMTWRKVGDLGNPYTVYKLICTGTSHMLHQNNAGNMYSLAAKTLEPGPVRYTLIDLGSAGQRLEPGASPMTETPNNGINGTNYGPNALRAIGFYDGYELSLTSVDWRDRGNSTGTVERLVRLGEDFVKHNDGTLTLTLGDLPAGRYRAASYHHDPDNPQSPRIQVYVSDAVSADRLQPTHGDASRPTTNVHSLTTAIMADSAASFEFYADGTTPVAIRFNGTQGVANDVAEDETPLNGLELILLEPDAIIPGLLPYALIDFGPSTQRVEAGAIALPNAPDNMQNGRSVAATLLTNANGGPFTLSIDNIATNGAAVGSIDWRDRGDATNTEALAAFAEDHIKNNLGIIRVTFAGLQAGRYRVESVHIDAENLAQCEDIRVYVTDAVGENVLQDLTGDADHTARPLSRLTTRAVMASASTFFVESDGNNDIVITFDGTAAIDTEVPLNGLRLQLVTDVKPTTAGTVVIVR